MMKRPATTIYAVLPILVALAVCVSFLFQDSHCSRLSPEQPRGIPPRPLPVVLREDDDEPHAQRHQRDNADDLEMEASAVGKKAARADGGAAASGTTAPAARDVVDHQDGSGSSILGGALMMKTTPTMRPSTVRLRSELPRRVLAGAPPVVKKGPVDSAAKSSCHSSDVHVDCPPSRN